ncbi:MAG TPA: TonB-dependent receptor, partial [Chitinophagaceae bacterium]|nr:TonB-dependent receptor [Chitinophagaceae bacterium]
QKIKNICFIALSFVLLLGNSAYAQKRNTKKINKKTTTKKVVTKKQTAATSKPIKPITTETPKKVNEDTTKPDVVIIYAAFKPSLRNAAKINFTAASPVLDSSKISLKYNVPAQNLFFSYQPVPLKPLALFVDSTNQWVNNQYVKVGYGGYNTPYIETGLSFGNGKSKLTSIYAMHTSSKGSMPFQQFGKTNLNIVGNYIVNNAHELVGSLYYKNNTQYQYGYQPNTLVFTKKDLKQQFNSIGVVATYKRKMPNQYGITYAPTLHINYFFDAKKAGEFNLIAEMPVTKTFKENFKLNVGLTADITAYKDNIKTLNNNLIFLNAGVQYKLNKVKFNIGLQPAFDNKQVNLLPNITAEAKLKNDKFILVAGFTGKFIKNNYNHLSSYNPWMDQPTFLANTRVLEVSAGFKGSAGQHFTYNASVGYLGFKNMPLFVNNTIDEKSFVMMNDANLQAIKIAGEVGYQIQEKFSFLAGTSIYQFTESANKYAYGILPIEINGSLKWKVLKDLLVKTDVFIWEGPKYLSKNNSTEKLSAAIDINIGAEYSIIPKLNLWLQFNNLFNNKYERWNRYEVLGLNVLAGVVYSFR